MNLFIGLSIVRYVLVRMISAAGNRIPYWKWLRIKTCVVLCSISSNVLG